MINKRDLQINTYNTDVLTYRGIADSSEMNYIFNSLKSNANKCILRTRKAHKSLNDLRNAYVYLNEYMNSKIRDLNFQANNLLINSASGLNTSIISFYDYEVINSGVINNLNADANYGQLALGEEYSWSKVTRFTDYLGDEKPTPDIKIYVDDVYREVSNDAYNSLDDLNYTIWLEPISTGDHIIRFQFPTSIKPKINSLKLDFFPQYSTIIKKIEYYSIKGVWEEIRNYDSDGRSIKIYFAPYDYGDQVRITLEPVSTVNPIIGISNFDLFLTNFKNFGTGTFKFPEVERYNITSLNSLKVDHYIDNFATNNQFSTVNPLETFLIIDEDEYKIPYNVINGTEDLSLNVGTINQKDIKIRFQMTEVNLTSPVVRGAVLSYTA